MFISKWRKSHQSCKDFPNSISIFSVKPAVFDLFLTSLIACYLFCVYFVIIHFSKMYDIVCKVSPLSTPAPTTNGMATHKAKTN